MRVVLATLGWWLLFGLTPAIVSAACAPGGTCGPSNVLSWTNVTTNANGTPLTDFAGFEARYAATTGACASSAATVKSLGPLGLGATPAAGTTQIPLSSSLLALPQGRLYITILAVDTGGARSACSDEVTFTYDSLAPNTTITSSPPAGGTSANFTFGSTESGTFECKLDAGAFAPCTSPNVYSGLSDGSHTFTVRALDAALNIDQTPATQTWSVSTTTPPPGTVTLGQCTGAVCALSWAPYQGAVRYQVARWTSAGWTKVATTTATSVAIPWPTGVAEHALFAVVPTNEGMLMARFWTTQ